MEENTLLHIFTLFGSAFLLIEGLMILMWMIYLIHKKISTIDIGWCVSFIFAALECLFFGHGYLGRRLLILALVLAWSIRLMSQLIKRMNNPAEEERYEKILNRPLFIGPYSLRVLSLYLLQGLAAALISFPFFLMAENAFPFFYPLEIAGLFIWFIGMAGLILSAHEEELSHYAGHLNYFFEVIVWLGYAIMAFSSPLGWLGLISPLLILILLFQFSKNEFQVNN